MKKNNKVFSLVVIALFTAIAYISSLALPIKVQFLTLDIKDAFLTIGALYFGPLSGVVMSFAVSMLELLFGSDTGIYGFIMNFIGSATFALVASLIYTYKRNLSNAVTGLFCACIAMTVVMIAANLIITPYFMAAKGMTAQAVEKMIVPLLLPFNLFKGLLNAGIVMLLYKPVSVALKKTTFNNDPTAVVKLNKNTLIVTVFSLLLVILSIVFIIVKLGGVLDLAA